VTPGEPNPGPGRPAPEPGGLTARTVPIADPGDLLARIPPTPLPTPSPASPPSSALAWVRQGSGLVGWGEVARITLPAGDDRFTAGEKWLRALFEGAVTEDQVRRPGTGPVAFGSFTFDPASDGSVLIVPRTILGRDPSGQAWLTTISDGREPGSGGERRDGGESRGHGLGGSHDAAVPACPGGPAGFGAPAHPGDLADAGTASPGLRWHDGSLTALEWAHAVAVAVSRISAGALHKVVLARDVFATAAGPIDARVLLRRLATRYPDCFTFSCANLVGATPELLVRRRGCEVTALILGGTSPRGAQPAEDAALGAALLASAKNTEEHAYAVTSVRDALAPLCAELDIPSRPSLLKLPNVHHLGTSVRGTLARDRSVLSLAGALHPPAAVCGTPAETALELIRELEHMERGRYAGPVGWVDAHGNGEFGIALRCAELDGRRARLFAGCGIVAGSDPVAEVAETEVKFLPMRQSLQGLASRASGFTGLPRGRARGSARRDSARLRARPCPGAGPGGQRGVRRMARAPAAQARCRSAGSGVPAGSKPILLNLAKLWLSRAITPYSSTTPASSVRTSTSAGRRLPLSRISTGSPVRRLRPHAKGVPISRLPS
jgi:menaquinone-specific isochorismate synthase